MTRENLLLITFVLLVAFFTVSMWNAIHRRAKNRKLALKPRVLIKEPRIKIMHNPFKNTYMWVRLNPRTRTWEWEIDATPSEVESWFTLPQSVLETGVLIERRDNDYVSIEVTRSRPEPVAEQIGEFAKLGICQRCGQPRPNTPPHDVNLLCVECTERLN